MALNPYQISPNIIPTKKPASTYGANQAWDGTTAFNMNGTSNIQPYGADNFSYNPNPVSSSQYTAAPAQNFSIKANPAAGVDYSGMPANTNPLGPQSGSGLAPSGNYNPLGPQSGTGLNPTSMPSTANPLGPQSGTGLNPNENSMPPQDTGAFNSQYATWDNIQPYMNPYLDKIISQGTNAIEHSAAGKGLFGSTGNVNDIGNWATNASSQAYNDAVNRFGQDRGYATDQYWNNRNADTSDAWKTYDANWDQYKYGNADYQGKLGDYYNQNNGVTNTGVNASNKAGEITQDQASALASLGLSAAQIKALGASAQGSNQTGMIDSLIKFIPLLLAA